MVKIIDTNCATSFKGFELKQKVIIQIKILKIFTFTPLSGCGDEREVKNFSGSSININ